jgi:hypothetical protein
LWQRIRPSDVAGLAQVGERRHHHRPDVGRDVVEVALEVLAAIDRRLGRSATPV